MSVENNKALIRHWIEEIWHRHNLDAADDLYGPDYVLHGAPPGIPKGPAGYRQLATSFLTAVPDIHFTIEDLLAEGDRVALRFVWSGTHRGELAGKPPTDSRITVAGMAFARIVDGKIAEEWETLDTLSMMQQLEAGPSESRST